MSDDTIIKYEPLLPEHLAMLSRTLRPIERTVLRIGDVDLSKGAGVLSDNRKCIWTTDGHRITFVMLHGGGLMGSISNKPDAVLAARVTTRGEGE